LSSLPFAELLCHFPKRPLGAAGEKEFGTAIAQAFPDRRSEMASGPGKQNEPSVEAKNL
jgi:hypothetical protein